MLHGLALNGQQGVEDVINTLKAELRLNMALAGAAPPQSCPQSTLLHQSETHLALHLMFTFDSASTCVGEMRSLRCTNARQRSQGV